MEDEFIEDDFLEESEGSANNRPFLIIVGALVTVFILAAACTLILLTVRGRAETMSAAAIAIETQNAITIVTNTAVAQFIAQTETAQALPTNTPELPSTNTSTPPPASSTPPPTETPVIDAAAGEGESTTGEEGAGAEGETETGGGEDTEEGVAGTIIIGGTQDASADSTGSDTGTTESPGTGSIILGGTATPVTATGGTANALPQTGLETWVIALFGLLLIGVLVAAHRLRTH